jgi:hypothetical protein
MMPRSCAQSARHNLVGLEMLHSGPALFQAGFMGTVIPGRALRASLESIIPVFAFGIQTSAQGVWIPGLRQVAHPGMTAIYSAAAAFASYR